ncbi:methionyl-tRNA formyltransferase [Adlercreutzia sp. ZJ473]|uniref:methionyl-tRNA formyltransferase n=1 Tax=Adlercreutzia sp. ZJ473 TaxID=2722822 RepID=UPI0015580D14|nr:methionyl-tRNA formyltransferase [Adlercreutzia sp. ZJ473]
MRIVFMGTPPFAATVLEELAAAHDVVGVYTRPDAVRGRGKKLVPSPVKELACALGLPVLTPRSLRSAEEQAALAALEPDVICVAAYGAILPREVLDIPRLGCLNVHGSLLPRWRGAAPVERAILAGDAEAGVCIMRMEEGLDTGDFCVSRRIPVGDLGAEALSDELANLGARALITALAHVEEGAARWTRQDEALVTYADKIAKGELDLDPEAAADVNARRVQASSAAHPARCAIAERGVTVTSARLAADGELPEAARGLGAEEALFAGKRLFLGCAAGVLEVRALKPDGKKGMDAKAFAAGVPALREGDAKWGRRHG